MMPVSRFYVRGLSPRSAWGLARKCGLIYCFCDFSPVVCLELSLEVFLPVIKCECGRQRIVRTGGSSNTPAAIPCDCGRLLRVDSGMQQISSSVHAIAPPAPDSDCDGINRTLGRLGYSVIRRVRTGDKSLAMLMHSDRGYAACCIDVAQRIVSTCDFEHSTGDIMSAVFSRQGLNAVLQWSDLPSAIRHFEIYSSASIGFPPENRRSGCPVAAVSAYRA